MATEASGEQVPGAGQAAVDWEQMLSQHARWLRTVVYARLGEPQAVDDVMQELSVAAIAQKRPLIDPTKVAPWLYRLAVRYVLLYRRKQGRRRKLVDRYVQRLPPGECGGADPLTWMLAEERRKLVRQALKLLAPRDAEILLLKYTEDWSYRDIADHLAVSHSAVEARLHRARQRLRDELVKLEVVGST